MYNIAFCCDDNYIIPATISIESLLETNRDIADNITFFTFHEGISDTNFNRLSELICRYGSKLKEINLISNFKSIVHRINTLDYITESTFYRLLLPYVLPDIDICLFIDSDILIRGSIKEIWDYYSDDICICAVADNGADCFEENLGIDKYCNAGVLLLNMQRIRGMYAYDEFVKEIEYIYQTYDLQMADQDLINIIFQDHFKLIPDIYNFQRHQIKKFYSTVKSDLENVKVVHFITNKKPWKTDYFYTFFREYYKYYRKYLSMSDRVSFWLNRFFCFLRVCAKSVIKNSNSSM